MQAGWSGCIPCIIAISYFRLKEALTPAAFRPAAGIPPVRQAGFRPVFALPLLQSFFHSQCGPARHFHSMINGLSDRHFTACILSYFSNENGIFL